MFNKNFLSGERKDVICMKEKCKFFFICLDFICMWTLCFDESEYSRQYVKTKEGMHMQRQCMQVAGQRGKPHGLDKNNFSV